MNTQLFVYIIYKAQSTNLGYKPSLLLAETQNGKIWILKMDNGDPKFCGQARRSEVLLMKQKAFTVFF